MIRGADLLQGPENRPRLEVVRDPRQFAAMRNEWGALLEQSDVSLFNAWEWLYPWHRRIGTGRELFILTARDRTGELAAVMPLCIELRRITGRLVRRLGFLGETHVGSDYLDVIARRGERESMARLFAEYLRDATREWEVLELLDVDSHSPTLSVFRRVFAIDPFQIRFAHRFVCPHETFTEGETFDAFLRRTGRRQNYLRRRKWLESQPGFHIEKSQSPRDLAQPLSEFFRLHAMRRDPAGGSMGSTGPEVEAFHCDATHLLAEKGWLRLYTLRMQREAVASVYGLAHRDTFLYYQAGYDPAWRSKSVDLVLVGETFRDTLETGLRAFHFLRGVEPYKSEWTTRERFTLAMRIWLRDGVGAWLTRSEDLGGAARAWARRVMPPALLDRIRDARSPQPGGRR